MCHFWWTPKSGVFPRDIVQIYNKKMHQNVVKNVKRRVLELLSANGPLKKSLPILQFFRANFCGTFAWSRRFTWIFCTRMHFRLVKEVQWSSAVCATYAGRVHANFVSMARQNSENFAILSRDFGAQFAWSRRRTRAFSDVKALMAWWKALKMSCELGSARWPSARNFLCAGRAENFQEFPNFFTRFGAEFQMRDPDRRALFQIWTDCRLGQLQRRCAVCAQHAGRMHATSVRAARQISKIFAIFSRDFSAKFAWPRRQTRAFSHLNALETRSRTATTFSGCFSACWPSSRNFSECGAPQFRKLGWVFNCGPIC